MGGFASSRILEVHGERMIKRTFDPGFRIELHQKDLNLALSRRRALGVALPNTATRAGAVQRLRRARRRQLGSLGAGARARDDGQPRDRPDSRPSLTVAARRDAVARELLRDACSTRGRARRSRRAACRRTCRRRPSGRTIVIGAGKASAAMARGGRGALAGRRSTGWSSRATATRVPCRAHRDRRGGASGARRGRARPRRERIARARARASPPTTSCSA